MTASPGSIAEPARVHPFEAAGLGAAPFRVVGVQVLRGPLPMLDKEGRLTGAMVGAPGQPMGSCRFCGTGIAECWMIRSADGKEFMVGCDCVRKVAAKGTPLRTEFERKLREHKAAADAARLDERCAKAGAILDADPALLADRPHSNVYMANFHKLTARDEVDFLLERAGASGRTRACQMIERAAAEKGAKQ